MTKACTNSTKLTDHSTDFALTRRYSPILAKFLPLVKLKSLVPYLKGLFSILPDVAPTLAKIVILLGIFSVL